MIIFLKHVRRQQEEDLTRLQDPPSGDVSPAESIEELTNVAEPSEKKHTYISVADTREGKKHNLT